MALSKALPIRNSRERSSPLSTAYLSQLTQNVQYTRFWSANVCACCVLFQSKTNRSRNASAVPPYAADSSQLYRERASVVSIWRTASFSNSSGVSKGLGVCVTLVYKWYGGAWVNWTYKLPPSLTLWLGNARLYALDLARTEARHSPLVLWPGEVCRPNRTLQVGQRGARRGTTLARRRGSGSHSQDVNW